LITQEVQTITHRAAGGAPGEKGEPRHEKDGAPLEYFGPSPRWRLLNLREFWRHREVLWALAVRDIKVRYRQTLVGVAWVILHPLAMASIFLVFFGLLGRQPGLEGVPYALIVLTGLLQWQLFSATVAQASASLVMNQQLIGKVYFPRLVLPLAAAVPTLLDFAVASILPVGVMIYYGVAPPWTAVFVPGFVVLTVAAALAVGIWLSALNAIYRDVGYVVPVLLQLGFFLSPVVYTTSSLIPVAWRPAIALNPMVGAIEGLRWSLLGAGEPPVLSVAISVMVTGFVMITGLAYFRRIEGFLADRI
jgi:lipopolysaccharide transport system permease protein